MRAQGEKTQGTFVAKTQIYTCSVAIKNPDVVLQTLRNVGVISVTLHIWIYIISISER